MKVFEHTPQSSGVEPRLLIDWAPPRRTRVWLVSLLLHSLGIGMLVALPGALFQTRGFSAWQTVTPLIAPPRELTQIEPNRGRIGHEFSLENLAARRPAPVVAAPAPQPVPPLPKPAAKAPVLPAPPKIAASKPLAAQAAPPGIPSAPPASPPQIQTAEKPKLAFETPGSESDVQEQRGLAPPRIAPPNTSITEAVRGAAQSGPHGLSAGDPDLEESSGIDNGLNVPPSHVKPGAALEMMSDPQGVDFRPYIHQILAIVKRNWLAVYPESARLGRRGRVQLQFIVARDGKVPKLVIAMPSGTDALDRAAVAGVSASAPFPPLPAEYRGNEVRLQFTFVYNMK
ncbi:MAG: TonB family protein [Bryobacteraceae bacterium]